MPPLAMLRAPFKSKFSSLIFFIILSFSIHAMAGDLVAKQDGVPVLKTPDQAGQVIKVLSKGESVEGQERIGMYWGVKISGRETGYVSVLRVVPRLSNDTLSKKIREAARSGNSEEDVIASDRTRSAAMGVRGLDDSGDLERAGSVRPNFRLVFDMENRAPIDSNPSWLRDALDQEIEANY